MRTKAPLFIIALSALAFTLSAQAHDPKEHMKNAEKPDCSAMKDMDHSKMDMDDPVTQAMMTQCMSDMHDEDNGMEHGDHDSDHDHDSDSDQDQEHQQADGDDDSTQHQH